MIFNAFGEGYLCILKTFLFLCIPILYFIYVLHEIYMEKELQELFWVPIPRSNGNKINLNVALHALFELHINYVCIMAAKQPN